MKEIALELSWAKAIERTTMRFLNSSDSEVTWVGTGVGAWGADEEDVAKRELNFDLLDLGPASSLGWLRALAASSRVEVGANLEVIEGQLASTVFINPLAS